MLKAIIGAVLVFWTLQAGIGTRETNRAKVFMGPIGYFVSWFVLLLGCGLIISAFF